MKRFLISLYLAFICSINLCGAEDASLIKHFLESCYALPYDPKVEMTDVVLINAYYTNQTQIKEMSGKVLDKLNKSTSLKAFGRPGWLETIFTASSMSNGAIIRVFRERTTDDFYRLDESTSIGTFCSYKWDAGGFTNIYPFLMTLISYPTRGSNNQWTCYTIQPGLRVSVRAGKKRCMLNEGFYIDIFGVTSLVRMNVQVQTLDIKASKEHDFSDPDHADFRFLKIDEKRLAQLLEGKGRFGTWELTHIGDVQADVGRLSQASTDGIDNDLLRVYFKNSKPEQRYLAYARDPVSRVLNSLYASDFDEKGNPVRLLKIEPLANGLLGAWAQNIIYISKTTNVDLALFNVDLARFRSIFDERPKYPVEIQDGKVVWNAAKDQYANEAVSAGRLRSGILKNRPVIIRFVLGCVFVFPAIILFFKMKSNRRPHGH